MSKINVTETVHYDDSQIKMSIYDALKSRLSIIYKSGHIDEYSVENKKDYKYFKSCKNQSEALNDIIYKNKIRQWQD